MHKNQRLAKKRIADKFRIALKRSWASGSHRKKQQTKELDAETVRARHLWDRKGNYFCSISLNQSIFNVCYSRLGRSDQFDIEYDGQMIATTRRDQILSQIEKFILTTSPIHSYSHYGQ